MKSDRFTRVDRQAKQVAEDASGRSDDRRERATGTNEYATATSSEISPKGDGASCIDPDVNRKFRKYVGRSIGNGREGTPVACHNGATACRLKRCLKGHRASGIY
jgi:hypothetical protein